MSKHSQAKNGAKMVQIVVGLLVGVLYVQVNPSKASMTVNKSTDTHISGEEGEWKDVEEEEEVIGGDPEAQESGPMEIETHQQVKESFVRCVPDALLVSAVFPGSGLAGSSAGGVGDGGESVEEVLSASHAHTLPPALFCGGKVNSNCADVEIATLYLDRCLHLPS